MSLAIWIAGSSSISISNSISISISISIDTLETRAKSHIASRDQIVTQVGPHVACRDPIETRVRPHIASAQEKFRFQNMSSWFIYFQSPVPAQEKMESVETNT